MTDALCKGAVELDPEVGTFSGANVHIYLEDVSQADANAKIVDKVTFCDAFHKIGTGSSLEFALRCEKVNPKSHYSVRVHIDLQREGQVYVGDYVTAQSYPVLTFGHPEHVTVHVKKVR